MRCVNWVELIVLCVLFCLNPAAVLANDPTHVAAITGAGAPNYLNDPRSVYVSNNYAYVASPGSNSLSVFDISGIAGGTITHKAAITGAGAPNYLGGANSVYVLGDYAYVASPSVNALSVFDISDVANGNITHKAAVTGAYAPNFLDSANCVYVSGIYAYVASPGDNSLTVFDISDVKNGNITHKALFWGNSGGYIQDAKCVYVSGSYAYVTSSGDYSLTVFDISDVVNGNIDYKTRIWGYGPPNYLNNPNSVYVSGDYAYVASVADNALTVFYIKDVVNGNITHKAAITGWLAPNYLGGADSVYVSGSGNYAYVVSDAANALSVFDISGIAAGTITLDGVIRGMGLPNYLFEPRSVYEVGGYAYVVSDDNALTVFHVPDSAHVPTVTTQAVTAITKTTATGNGNITDLGTTNPTAYGVCWNTTGVPSIHDDKTDEGGTGGPAPVGITSGITGLSPGTDYYVRAYATNTTGTAYGSQVSFISTGKLATGNPISYKVTVTKVEMHNEDSAWVTIFSGTAQLDMEAGGTFPGISDLDLPAGTYDHIRITFKNSFPVTGTLSNGGTAYYTTATTFEGQTNLDSTSTPTAGDMAEFTFYEPAWGALNADVMQTYSITPFFVGRTDYLPTLRFTVSTTFNLNESAVVRPDPEYFTLGVPPVNLVEP